MTNKDYWARRAESRMSGYMRQSEAVAKDLERVYSGVYKQINEDSKAIMQAFQRAHGLSEAEAKALLKIVTGKDAAAKLREVLAKTKDPKKAAELKMLLESPAYKYRIARLQKVLDSVDGMAKDVYGVELTRTTRHYRDLFDEVYMRSMFDAQRGTGLGFSFAAVDPNTVDAVLAYEWSGEHYSSLIWGHCSDMAQTIKDELLIGVLTGRSWRKTANNIAERCGVGAFEARRLVRTESAAIASRAEQAMYEEADIEQYEFLATLDNRTSEECQKLDGKVFAVKDAKIGVNMPPMHAFCRSTTVAYFDDEVLEGLHRRARDPETGKTYTVPQDMTYKEWEKSVDEKYGVGTLEKHRKMAYNRSADREQYTRYVKRLGADAPETFEDFQELKYNQPEQWEYVKGLFRYLSKYPSSSKPFYDVWQSLKKLGINKGVVLPPVQKQAFILPEGKRDPYHIMHRMRERGISDDELRDYMKNAKCMFVQWSGARQRFVSEKGICVIVKSDDRWIFKTAWKRDDYDEEVDKIMKVISDVGL